MKHFLYIVSIFFFTSASAQNCKIPTNELGKFEISEVVEVAYSKEEITNAALLAVADFANDPNNITKFRDVEASIFISEIAAKVKTTIGFGNYFYFNLKMEVKEGKYRMTANYLDCLFFVTADTSCKCSNDLAEQSCQPNGCLVSQKRWNMLRCRATEELYIILQEYTRTIDANLAKSDW